MVLVLTPIVGFIVGDRFSYIILRSLYMQNRSEGGSENDNNSDNFDSVSQVPNGSLLIHESRQAWVDKTEPYRETPKNQFLLHKAV